MVEDPRRAEPRHRDRALDGFYESVRCRVDGIDCSRGRQKVITDLYEKFFKKAVPKTADSLGIVYTPVEIVDFINRAVNDLLDEHFDGASLSTKASTYSTRSPGRDLHRPLLQSGLISPDDLARKFHQELHANELLLLADDIAAVNIETAFRGEWRTPGCRLTSTSRSRASC